MNKKDIDINIKGAEKIIIRGVENNNFQLTLNDDSKIDINRKSIDIDLVLDGGEALVELPKEIINKIELGCTKASVEISNLSFDSFEIDSNDNLDIKATDIAGSLEINQINAASTLTIPASYSFRTVTEGKNNTIDVDASLIPEESSGNKIELNGKGSTLVIKPF